MLDLWLERAKKFVMWILLPLTALISIAVAIYRQLALSRAQRAIDKATKNLGEGIGEKNAAKQKAAELEAELKKLLEDRDGDGADGDGDGDDSKG